LRVIINTAVAEYELPRNPIALVKDLDTSTWHTYTEEQPNSLTPSEVPVFLAKLRELYPQHFAFVALGFATGLRPSSLRPLRRRGDSADVLWDQGVLLVRRSQTGDAEPMETTKTGKLQRISLPEDLIEILDWHVKQLPEGPMRDSDLLFPSETGEYRAASCLDRPFREITTQLKWKKEITPRAMRRTSQDLARAAEVRDIVTRSVSGHSTKAMQRHYSTVTSQEQSGAGEGHLAGQVPRSGAARWVGRWVDRGRGPEWVGRSGNKNGRRGVIRNLPFSRRRNGVGRTGFGNVEDVAPRGGVMRFLSALDADCTCTVETDRFTCSTSKPCCDRESTAWDPVSQALQDAQDGWSALPDARSLRSALLHVLAMLDRST
jgi:hypothetical protein